jgi:hypothetical protein
MCWIEKPGCEIEKGAYTHETIFSTLSLSLFIIEYENEKAFNLFESKENKRSICMTDGYRHAIM